MNKYFLLLTALVAVVYSSCNKINGPTPDALQSISLRDTLSMYTGNIVSLDIQVAPASYDTTAFVWGSSDTSVIAVTNKGKITAKNEGTSTISVSNAAKTKSVSCIVTVKDSLGIDLLAYYPFNNSAIDATGHGYDGVGTDLTTIADRFGKANSAYRFNGTSSVIIVKDKQSLRLNGTDFTINYWVNLDNYSNSYGTTVLSKRDIGNANGWITGVGGALNAYSIVGKVGTITYNVSGGSDPFGYGQLVVGINAWHMLTVVYNYDESKVSLYVDGVFDRTTNNVPTPNALTSKDMFIGADSQGADNASYYDYLTKGGVDDIRIYKKKLTAYEIHKLFVVKK